MSRYIRQGECNHCGWCCMLENPPCPHLMMKNGKSYCKIWEGDQRKEIGKEYCIHFPSLPPITHDECGYYFIDTWEENKIVKRIV